MKTDTKKKELELGRGASLPERSAMPAEYKWKLEDIFASAEDWEKSFAAIKSRIPEIAAYKGALAQSPEKMLEFFKLRDELSIELGKLYVYANMKSHEDTGDSKQQGPANRVSALAVEFSAAASYVTPEILAMDDGRLKEFIAAPCLADYAFPLRELLRRKAHVLSEAEELILARSGDMAQTADNAFSMLTNADMEFPPIRDEEGKKVEMSEERAVAYLRSPKRSVRKAAFASLYEPYGKMKNTIGATFDGMLKAAKFYAGCRRYGSPLEEALDADNIPVSVYDSLVSTIEDNLAPMYRYMKLRRRMLGVRELHMYDLYVPLVEDPYKEIAWSDAKKMMYDYLAPLGGQYIEQIKAGVEGGWADVFPNKGKRSGAYSWGSYGTHPYIFMNYTNNLNDVMTLVHEMGHSMHSWYSRRNQPYATADYCIFTAEVASTTNEVLFLSGLLTETGDRKKTPLPAQPPPRKHPHHRLPPDDVRVVRARSPQTRRRRRGHDPRRPQTAMVRAQQKILRRSRNDRRAAQNGMGAHPALLYALLRLPVRDRLLRRYGARRRDPSGGRACDEEISGFPHQRRLRLPDRAAQRRGGGHEHAAACRSRRQAV